MPEPDVKKAKQDNAVQKALALLRGALKPIKQQKSGISNANTERLMKKIDSNIENY